jgi:hypothetical protein
VKSKNSGVKHNPIENLHGMRVPRIT